MKKIVLLLFAIFAFSSCSSTSKSNIESESKVSRKVRDWKDIVSINQEGYLVGAEKYFITNIEAMNFTVKGEEGKEPLFTGDVELYVTDDSSSGETLYIGYFSDFKNEGKYYIELDSGQKSYDFTIGDSVYNDVREKSLKSFYYQRSGVPLLEEHAGIYSREAGHKEELEFHPKTENYEKGKTKDVTGGWYDAGDYGRYITPASVALGVMFMGYENYSEKFTNDNSNIPESGNGVPDFIDEMKFELDWMLKMQNHEGGDFKGALPYMVNSRSYASGMPNNASEMQYIYGFSSSATAGFAATMALASRVLKDFDNAYPGYSEKCLEAAELAWAYLESNPKVYPPGGYQRPADTDCGGYAAGSYHNSVDKDDRAWAAIEMYRTTGEKKYLEAFTKIVNSISSWKTVWSDLSGYSKIQYILTKEYDVDEDLRAKLKASFLKVCDFWVERSNKDGFKTVLGNKDYIWGNNGEVLLNRAALILLAYQITGDKKYYNASLAQMNYVLGLNVHNKSFIAHTGTDSTRNIHHVMFYAKGYIFPGLLTGGPNSSRGDYIMQQEIKASTPPAKCYLDNIESYASNENCILYNAPLVPVSAFFAN